MPSFRYVGGCDAVELVGVGVVYRNAVCTVSDELAGEPESSVVVPGLEGEPDVTVWNYGHGLFAQPSNWDWQGSEWPFSAPYVDDPSPDDNPVRPAPVDDPETP